MHSWCLRRKSFDGEACPLCLLIRARFKNPLYRAMVSAAA